MTLQPGTRLGPYEILAAIGAGGMGEVYRARDTKLGRDVAIKVLPESFAKDPERIARFQREAQVLASLNHPHIAAIYGLEDSGGVSALVLELVEGPTLADRMAEVPRLPLAETLAIARQMAEALEAAHEQGIVHRDLKPANVKLRADDAVKVLDFGLAAVAQGSGIRDANLSNSPTLTMQATEAGFIIGTAAYMSPEQASGKPVDRRADIWSFGVVLWELLTGQRLFDGETVSHTLADVLRAEVDFSKLPETTPAAIRELLRRCLDRDVKSRLRDIGEARIVIDRAIAQPEPPRPARAESRAGGRLLPWIAAGVLGAGLAVTLVLWAPWKKAPAAPVAERLSVSLGADATLQFGAGTSVVISPDGQALAFVGAGRDGRDVQLYVRRLDQLQAKALTGTTDASNPFFSPDGQWIGFFAGGKLKKVSVTGSATVTLCDAAAGRGGAWADDGTIVFTPDSAPGTGLQRVSAGGGKPAPLFALAAGEATERWPQLLPGGKQVLYTASSTVGSGVAATAATVVVRNLATGERKVVQSDGYYGRYLPSGHLVYVHDGTLFAAPFDLARLELAGQPAPVVDGLVASVATAGAQFSFSDTGTLVYAPGRTDILGALPVFWMDKNSRFTPLIAKPAIWTDIRFSPDGRRVAMDIFDGKQRDVWIYEWERDTMTRLTFDPNDDASPVWTPDGTRIVFASKRADKFTYNLYWQRADGTGDVQRLTESKNHQIPNSWKPGGTLLVFHEITPGTQTSADVKLLSMEGSESAGWKAGTPTVFLNSPAAEQNPMFSPDGKWMAYESNESGRFEIYVRPFPGPGGKWQVSNGGGTFATWSRARHELFYGSPDLHVMVAPYTVEGESFRAEKPRPWSEGRFTPGLYRRFDVHPDGERFAVSKDPDPQSEKGQDQVVFVLNFFDELRRIAR